MSTTQPYLIYCSNKRRVSFLQCITALFVLCLFTIQGFGQDEYTAKPVPGKYQPADTTSILADTTNLNGEAEIYEEASITLHVQDIGSIEIPGYILKEQVYLPVQEIFNFLKIKNTPSVDYEMLDGFFIQPEAIFRIDKKNNKIIYREKMFTLDPGDLVIKDDMLFLKSNYFGQVFGLDCVFDPYSLSVNLTTKIQLPAIRDKQIDMMHQNLNMLRGDRKADTSIGKKFTFFNLGNADWSVFTAQATNEKPLTWASLGIGAVLAGGELNVTLNYKSNQTFDLRQQFYEWHYVNNDHAALRQVTAGKLFPQSIASIYGPVTGIKLTNTPTSYRRSFGTYIISNTTEPGWMVELYLNDVLINFTKADASGFYMFDVPMIYGNSVVKLKFYGPWGEERTSEKFIAIPFNFIPLHQFEYSVTAGIVEDDQKSKYSRASFSYGLSRRITVGGGMEYLSSTAWVKNMPFLNATMRIGQHLLFSGEYAYLVRSKWLLNYSLPSNLQVDISYTRYNKNQTAVRTNYLDEKRMVISMPIRRKKITGFTRFTLSRYSFPNSTIKDPKTNAKYTAAEWLLSVVRSGVGANLTTYALFNEPGMATVYSNLSFNFRLPAGIRFAPQVQYEYRQKKFRSIKAEAEKNIFNRCYINLAYEKVFINNYISSYTHSFTLGFRYDLSFAQTFFSVRKSNLGSTATQSARGSLLYDAKTNYVATNNQGSVGKAGIVFMPYLDMNANGKRDGGEPAAAGLKININGGHTSYNKSDSTIIITQLDAYTYYFAELDISGMENISWQVKNQKMNIMAAPNQFKRIAIPVAVMGEVNGTVFQSDSTGKKGIGRIIVHIYNSSGEPVGRTISEADGYFSFMGLKPGSYTAAVDAAQLQKFNWRSASIPFTIAAKAEGDYAGGLTLILQN